MTEYDDTDRGALFKNEDKQSDKHPDYKGNINVGGQEFWLSAWIKTSKKGQKFMSLSVKAKDAPKHNERGGGPVRPAPQTDGFEDQDIPFLTNRGEF